MNIKEYNNLIMDKLNQLEEIYPFAYAFIQSSQDFYVRSSTNEDSISFNPINVGAVIKIFNGESFYEYAFSPISEQKILEAFNYFKELSSQIKIVRTEIKSEQKIKKDFYQKCEIDPLTFNELDYLKESKKLREKIEKMSNKIVQVRTNLGYKITEEVYLSTRKELYQKLYRFDNIYSIIFNNGEKSSEIFGGHSKIGGFEHANLDFAIVEKDVKNGEIILEAPRLNPGIYDCIFAPGLSGMLAHEAFGHGTETDMFLKKRAKAEEFLGQKVAFEKLNMWDSAALSDNVNASGSFFFDHEGKLSEATQIIKDGVLVSAISDLYSSYKLKLNKTSNGRSESFLNKVYARMTNTYFEAGEDKLEDMIKSIKYGFLVDYATNGMEDPKGWGMQLEALYAEEIIEGKLSGKVYSPVIITGYVPDTLKSISMISDYFELVSMGYCGKGHKEWVKVTDGGPYLKLRACLA